MPIRSRGVTVLELAAAIAIIGLLCAMLLPAVLNARETSRRANCRSNLRQLGLALASYVDTERSYPWGRVTCYDSRVGGSNPQCRAGIVDKGFLVQLLPYLEAGELFGLFNHQVSVFSLENDTPRGHRLGIFTCPADDASSFDAPPAAMNPFFDPSGRSWRVSPTSYVACFGTVPVIGMPSNFSDCKVPRHVLDQADGPMTDISPLRVRDITDGLSKTMFVAERAFGAFKSHSSPRPDEAFYHGWWFSGNLGDSLFTAFEAPNAFKRGRRGSADFCGSASMHDGGLHVLMGDGSVHWVSDSISSWPFDNIAGVPKGATRNSDSSFSDLPPRGVWQAMATRAGNDGGI